MGLVNGSREFYDLSEHAERLYRAASEARSTEERLPKERISLQIEWKKTMG